MLGAPKEVSNTDPLAIDACKAAVAKYNADKGTNLEFVSIVSLTGKVVAGMIYEGTIQTNDGNYKIKTWYKAWEKFTQNDLFEKA